jgi:hypothetical protein
MSSSSKPKQRLLPKDVCRFYLHNKCKKGDECAFKHIDLKSLKKTKNKTKKNTESFEPINNSVADIRIVYHNKNEDILNLNLTPKDLLIVNNLFSDFHSGEIYNKLMNEINTCGIDINTLLKLWHGNDKIEGTHFIADDKLFWKDKCPTFNMVLSRIKTYFNMNIKSSRFNLYTNTHQWKALHFDASAIKPYIAKMQNYTLAVSFGVTREIILERDTKDKTKIALPIGDGVVYGFTHEINCTWRHGVLQDIEKKEEGRISIIAWGWMNY